MPKFFKLAKIIHILIFIILASFSVFCGLKYFNLRHKAYNSEGRYFDANEAVIYLEQSLGVFAILAIISLSLFVIFLVYLYKLYQTQ